jgi:hypothetical protein
MMSYKTAQLKLLKDKTFLETLRNNEAAKIIFQFHFYGTQNFSLKDKAKIKKFILEYPDLVDINSLFNSDELADIIDEDLLDKVLVHCKNERPTAYRFSQNIFSYNVNITEDFIRKYYNYIDWNEIDYSNEKFLEEFFDIFEKDIRWKSYKVSRRKWSIERIKKYFDKISLKDVFSAMKQVEIDGQEFDVPVYKQEEVEEIVEFYKLHKDLV